jgi:hypothetical protein
MGLSGGDKMTNFEKFKQDLTIERLTSMLLDTYCEWICCGYCVYDCYTCANDCEHGIKKWLESEVE